MRNEGVKWEKLKINKCVIHLSVCLSQYNYTWCLKSYFLHNYSYHRGYRLRHSRLCMQHTAVREVARPSRPGASSDVHS